MAPQGLSYQVRITLTFGPQGTPFRPNPAPTSAPRPERGRSWYRGDCHLHTVYSDGRRTPQQLVADARAAGLDFIVSTDHNTGTTGSILDQLGVEHSETVPASGQATVTWPTFPRYSRWLRAEVRRPTGGGNTTEPNAMVAMTNTIFLGEV